jgi:hypothetical protein
MLSVAGRLNIITFAGHESYRQLQCACAVLIGTVGYKFTRALKRDPELEASYKEAKGIAAKAAFRTKWASLQLAAAEKVAKKRQTHALQERLEGRYIPFKKLWEAEGEDASGFAVAHVQYEPDPSFPDGVGDVLCSLVCVPPWP